MLKELSPTDRFDAERMRQLADMVEREEQHDMRAKMDEVSERVRQWMSLRDPVVPNAEPRDVQRLYSRNRVAEQLLRGLIRLVLSDTVETDMNPRSYDELGQALKFLTGTRVGDA